MCVVSTEEWNLEGSLDEFTSLEVTFIMRGRGCFSKAELDRMGHDPLL